MPEPTVPTPGEDDSTEVTPEHSMPKLQGKSGFDPSAYEADMVARKETTRMQELPPRVRMY